MGPSPVEHLRIYILCPCRHACGLSDWSYWSSGLIYVSGLSLSVCVSVLSHKLDSSVIVVDQEANEMKYSINLSVLTK